MSEFIQVCQTYQRLVAGAASWPDGIEVRRIGGDGSIRRARLDTPGRDDAARWERLADPCYLQAPPPYRAELGQPVYEVCAGDRVAQVAGELPGPLGELVAAVLAEGDDG